MATTAAAGPEPTAAPPATAPPATEPSAITAPWAARTFRTAGGTVTVRVIGGAFQAPVVVADAGWSAEVRKAETDRVEVRFRGGPSDDDLSLKLSLGSDGSIVVDGG